MCYLTNVQWSRCVFLWMDNESRLDLFRRSRRVFETSKYTATGETSRSCDSVNIFRIFTTTLWSSYVILLDIFVLLQWFFRRDKLVLLRSYLKLSVVYAHYGEYWNIVETGFHPWPDLFQWYCSLKINFEFNNVWDTLMKYTRKLRWSLYWLDVWTFLNVVGTCISVKVLWHN